MTTKNLRAFLATAALLAACDPAPAPTDTGPGTDAPPGTDTGMITNDCAGYCTQIMANCTAANAQYDDMADCMAYCADAGWPAGTPGETSGNTLACRIYHGGDPAVSNATLHCPHAGPTGDATCGDAITFRTEAPAMFDSPVDRMGMPAVATALVPSTARNAYNDGTPDDDALFMFAGAALTTLGAIHGNATYAAPGDAITGLDDDLAALNLAPCSMVDMVTVPGVPIPVPECAAQTVGGTPVAFLVIPDTLRIDPAGTSGFPNGRALADPVIDVTLSIILLDLSSATGCMGGPCTPTTLVGVVNPDENDVAFPAAFPYLAPAHTL